MKTNNIGLAIISPSGYAQEESDFLHGVDVLKGLGYGVHSYYDHENRFERFGATDETRIRQFHEAATNPDVQIVMALRGGYGLSRLLPHLDYDLLAKSGKLFVGHSDFTVFNMALLAQTRGVSFSGPMLCNDFARKDGSAFTHKHFFNCLTQADYTISWEAENNPVLNTSGTLWGGNLTMLTHMIGTPWMPAVEGGILFVEDINEHPYRIERLLLQLIHAGILEKQNALVLGDFANYEISTYDNGYDFNSLVSYLHAHLSIPVITGLPFGHIRDKVTLPVGSHANLTSKDNSVQLHMNGHPTIW